MTQAEIDKLTDELIDANERYGAVAVALGFDDVSDPRDYHFDVLQRAKELARFARVA